MLYDSEQELTDAVVRAMLGAPDPLLGERLSILVRGLHDVVRAARLSESEWSYVIDFVSAVGKACDDSHNEAVLLADVLGLSTLVMLLNGQGKPGEEDGALLGPFYREGAPLLANGASILHCETPGEPLIYTGQVVDPDQAPLAGVVAAVWQSSPAGFYENQDPCQADMNLRGRFITDTDGRFSFRSVRPAGYPVPTHGPTGTLLRAIRRSPYRPAHLHFVLYKEGWETLVTQRFFDTEEALEGDAVYGARRSLVSLLDQGADGCWYGLSSFTMRPGEAHWPRPPIR